MESYRQLAEKLNEITEGVIEAGYDDTEEMRLFEEMLTEFKGDTDKQCVVLMGLPAAGKSTFIKDGTIKQHITGFSGYKVVNSDAQLLRVQHLAAKIDYERLSKRVHDQKEWDRVIKQFDYKDNSGNIRKFPLTREEFLKIKNFGRYYGVTYKPYYATYFDLRDIAKFFDKDLFKDKIQKSSNILVIDTVAARPETLLKRLERAKEEGFFVSIFYLMIKTELSIIRDKDRGEREGRTVGEKVIYNYASKMAGAYRAYIKECGKKDGLVDKLYKFSWHPKGSSVRWGTWSLDSKTNCSSVRQLANMKDKVMAQGEDVDPDEESCACGR